MHVWDAVVIAFHLIGLEIFQLATLLVYDFFFLLSFYHIYKAKC